MVSFKFRNLVDVGTSMINMKVKLLRLLEKKKCVAIECNGINIIH